MVTYSFLEITELATGRYKGGEEMFLSKNWNPEIKENFKEFYTTEMRKRVIEIEDKGFVDTDIFKKMAENGYFNASGENLPADIFDFAAVLKEVAKVSGSWALAYHINILSSYAISTAVQDKDIKEKYLKAIKEDGKVCAFALTEPAHGSDLSSLDTKITEHDKAYILSGDKKYIVNGINAELFIVAGQKEDAVYTLLVDKEENPQGITVKKLNTLGVKGSGLASVNFSNVYAGEGNVIGRKLMDVLNLINFDRIGSIIMALGMAESAFEKALSHIRQRKQFGKSIGDFQGVQFIVAEMASSLKIIDHLVDLTLRDFSRNEVNVLSLSINKLECTRLMEEIVSKSIDLMGGSGYLEEFEVARIYRDSKSVAIGGGTREVLKNLIGKQMVYKHMI